MSSPLELLASIGMAIGVGVASAVIPIVNAEVAVSTAGLTMSIGLALGISIALATGQTLGKICLFEAARKGAEVRAAKKQTPKKPTPPWQQRLLKSLEGRWRTNGVVLLSAGLGLPPLALVSIAAGAVKSRRVDFAVCCLAGRSVRFVTVAVSALLITS
jgi:membrane protein YqaA with SNARE-associated domain